MGTRNSEIKHKSVRRIGVLFRIVIPEQIRESLGLMPGAPILIFQEGERIVIEKVSKDTPLTQELNDQLTAQLTDLYYNVQSGQIDLEHFVRAMQGKK